jgi:hypothetical protein
MSVMASVIYTLLIWYTLAITLIVPDSVDSNYWYLARLIGIATWLFLVGITCYFSWTYCNRPWPPQASFWIDAACFLALWVAILVTTCVQHLRSAIYVTGVVVVSCGTQWIMIRNLAWIIPQKSIAVIGFYKAMRSRVAEFAWTSTCYAPLLAIWISGAAQRETEIVFLLVHVAYHILIIAATVVALRADARDFTAKENAVLLTTSMSQTLVALVFLAWATVHLVIEFGTSDVFLWKLESLFARTIMFVTPLVIVNQVIKSTPD